MNLIINNYQIHHPNSHPLHHKPAILHLIHHCPARRSHLKPPPGLLTSPCSRRRSQLLLLNLASALNDAAPSNPVLHPPVPAAISASSHRRAFQLRFQLPTAESLLPAPIPTGSPLPPVLPSLSLMEVMKQRKKKGRR
jgi:hypothetical protein